MQALTFRIEIPKDRHISLDLPETVEPGPAEVIIVVERGSTTDSANASAWLQHELERLEPDRIAFQSVLAELQQTHLNQFVLMYQGKLVDAHTDRAALIQRARARNYHPFYLKQVTSEPRIVEIPSPEKVGHVPV
jgi:hypothetical protein